MGLWESVAEYMEAILVSKAQLCSFLIKPNHQVWVLFMGLESSWPTVHSPFLYGFLGSFPLVAVVGS
jgi:hypothetical protein